MALTPCQLGRSHNPDRRMAAAHLQRESLHGERQFLHRHFTEQLLQRQIAPDLCHSIRPVHRVEVKAAHTVPPEVIALLGGEVHTDPPCLFR